MPLRSSVRISPPPPPSLSLLLGISNDEDDREAGLARLAEVAACWPLAAMVQGVAVTIALIVDAGSMLAIALALIIAFASATMLFATGARRGPETPHIRARVVTIAAAILAGAMLALIWIATKEPGGAMQAAAILTLSGAIGLAGLAVHPVRAASLAFGAGLVVALGLLLGSSLLVVEAIAILLALGIATLRLSRLDRVATLDRTGQANEARIATRMIAEFEIHGTGWFWESDRHGRVTYLSARVAAEIAEHDDAPVGRCLTDIFRMDGVTPGTERTLAFHLSSRTSFSDYPVCAVADREGARWWSISGRPMIDDLGRFQGFIGSGSDLTEKRRSEAEITRLAMFDGLTGLANRQRMRLSLDKTLAQGVGRHRPASLFLMDLDRFKAVNDTLGHQAGDALLKQVAQRLQRGVGEQGLVGRLGGDEFQVLLPGMDGREPLATLAMELIASLSQPYFIAGASVTIGCSIGIALSPQDGEDAETLVRNADLALYAAKADGRGVHRFYHENMLAGARNRQQLEDDLRAALTAGDFRLNYQPIVSTADTSIVGYEALVRWQHPVRGIVSPADFIPVAEECGLIEGLGEWVLRTACAEASRWPRNVRVAVNVSPIQFANPQLPAIVTSALAQSGLAADRLELEITEGVFLDGSDNSERMFQSLKGIGVRLALDDFGTGYSSLGYLRTAPFDKIKIDQSFVRGAAQPGNRNAAIIRAIVTLADTLGMETTAEGVEIQDEIDLVRDLGCSHIQGYVYGRPAPAEDVAAALGIDTHARPIGFKVSRAPRTRMLRSARMMIHGRTGDVRIRDISTTGAMIDGLPPGRHEVGVDVLIELVENQMMAAQVRWAEGGRVGLRFAEPVDLRTLAANGARHARRAG